jgi:hypothetical protein
VVDDIDGVANVVPDPKLAPPDAAAYQLIVPADAVAARVTAPVPQTLPGVVPVIVGTALTVKAEEPLAPVLPLYVGLVEPIEIL